MAKKGQAIQLQIEVNNDEEWEKLLQKEGLIDIYSEWCGPCSGMAANLKKLKLEIGGDLLQLAIAKADKITALERFRNKSEPTWMFIVNGKMVNFMFGANAPKLTRLITEELKKENEAREGKRERVEMDIGDLAEEEKERQEVVEKIAKQARDIEEAKKAKELLERRTAECQGILETLSHMGVILIFPHAKDRYVEAFGDLLGEAGVVVSNSEKVHLNQQIIEELFYFEENPFPEDAMEELLTKESLILLFKPMPARELEDAMDAVLLHIIYGKSMSPPGDHNSPAEVLSKIPQETSEGEEEEVAEPIEMVGIWAPLSELVKATALRLFFPKLVENYILPEPEPIPPHFAVAFEAYRRHEIAKVMETYPSEILRYGFFSTEVPEEAECVAKTIHKFEKMGGDRTLKEKMVIQLAKRKSECVLAFAQLKPYYMSPNTKEGERECKLFFPDDYDEPLDEEEIALEEAALAAASQPRIIEENIGEGAEIADEDTDLENPEETAAETSSLNAEGAEPLKVEEGSENVQENNPEVAATEQAAPDAPVAETPTEETTA